MKSLELIPIPPAQRWREFRVKVLPGLAFAAVLAAVVLIWRETVVSTTVLGEAEPIQAQVVSPLPGVLSQLKVARFEHVRKDEIVGLILPSDPRTQLSLLQSRLDVLRTRLEPRLSLQRNATDYAQLRLDVLIQKVQLETARVNRDWAEKEVKRYAELFGQKLVSEEAFLLALKTSDELKTQVREQATVVADLEKTLKEIEAAPASPNPASTEQALTLLAEEENNLKQIQAELGPIPLTAPIEGMVSLVHRHPGENVLDGEPIVTIAALKSERIVGYLRQPFPFEPAIGMPVQIRTRSRKRLSCDAQITQVGAQLEPITNALAWIRPGILVDMGLPFSVNMPPGLPVRPGETVDLILSPPKSVGKWTPLSFLR